MEKNKQKEILDLFAKVKQELNLVETDAEQEKPLHPLETLELEFISLLEQNAKLEEARLIAVADNQNTVKRFQNEAVQVRKYGGEKLASEMLPAVDMFRTVFASLEDKPEIKNYLMGFEMIVNQIDQALANSGVTLITTKVGDDLNPELHNAIEQVETKDVPSGKIVAIVSNGYKLFDRVIKHVVVKVAK